MAEILGKLQKDRKASIAEKMDQDQILKAQLAALAQQEAEDGAAAAASAEEGLSAPSMSTSPARKPSIESDEDTDESMDISERDFEVGGYAKTKGQATAKEDREAGEPTADFSSESSSEHVGAHGATKESQDSVVKFGSMKLPLHVDTVASAEAEATRVSIDTGPTIERTRKMSFVEAAEMLQNPSEAGASPHSAGNASDIMAGYSEEDWDDANEEDDDDGGDTKSPLVDPDGIVVGSRVEARVEGWTQSYSGVVTALDAGKYDILFDDGDRVKGVLLREILRVSDHVDVVADTGAPADEYAAGPIDVNVSLNKSAQSIIKDLASSYDPPNDVFTQGDSDGDEDRNQEENDGNDSVDESGEKAKGTSENTGQSADDLVSANAREAPVARSVPTVAEPPPIPVVKNAPPAASQEWDWPGRVSLGVDSGNEDKMVEFLKVANASLENELRSAKVDLQAQRSEYEADINELRQKVQSSNAKIYELEILLKEARDDAAQRASRVKRLSSSSDVESMTKEDIAALRSEVEMQEKLIQGYQKENEKMTERLREVEKEADEKRQALYRENMRLGIEFNKKDNEVRSMGALMISSEGIPINTAGDLKAKLERFSSGVAT